MPDAALALARALPPDAVATLLPILLEELTAGVALLDPAGRRLFANARFDAMLPLPHPARGAADLADQLAGWQAAGFIDAATRDAIAAAFAAPGRAAHAWRAGDGRDLDLTFLALPGGGRLLLCRDQTEARQAAEALATERERSRHLLTNLRDCVVLIDPDGVILLNSASTGDILLLPPELAVPGATHQDILRHMWHRGDFGFDTPVEDFVSDRRARIYAARNITYPSRMPDGSWVEYIFKVLEDDHLLVIVRDITALKQRELELERERAETAEQRDRLDTLLRHLNDFVVLMDEEDRILLSSAHGGVVGLPEDAIAPGAQLQDIYTALMARGDLGPPPADPAAAAAERVAEIRAAGGLRTVRRLASGLWAEIVFRTLPGGRLLMVGRDVSEMKEAEQAVAAERTLLREVLESMDAMVVLLDSQGRIILSNGRGNALLGVPAALTEVGGSLGATMRYMVARGDFGEGVDADALAEARVREALSGRSVRVVRPSVAGRCVEFAYIPISGQRVVTQGRDITELKQREAELEQERDAAEAAGRAKAAFLAAMSHEIRTPMNGVLGMLEVLGRSALGPDQARAVAVMRESAQALLRILDDVLDFSKIEAGRMELEEVAFSLPDLVYGTLETLLPEAARRGLALFADPFVAGPKRLVGDPTRVRQILFNLLGNALKFTERGFVRVIATTAVLPDGRAEIGLVVEDSGVGMDAETLARLFQPFTQADSSTTRRFGGTGLGLSIVRRLAELMDGEVRAESAPGRGSRFFVTLRLGIAAGGAPPVAAASPPAARPAAMPGEAAPVLLVDDHPINREVLGRQLDILGVQAASAANGVEALAVWRRDRPGLILLDIHMPEMDGFELARAIRAEEMRLGLPRTTLIAVTANALRGEAERCYAAGMDGFLAKPVALDDLGRALGRFLPHLAGPEGGEAAGGALFDPAALRGLFGQDQDRLRSILDGFAEQARLDIAGMAAAADNPAALAGTAHRLKGASRMVGAVLLAEEAQAIEQAARAGGMAEAGRITDRLPALLEETMRVAQAALRRAMPASRGNGA